jgi:dihydroorotase
MKEDNIFYLPAVIIDTHCHGRDMEESHKTTMKQVLTEAKGAGIGTTFFMPNTKPSNITISTLEQIIALNEKARIGVGIKDKQYVFFGVTDDNLAECDEALEYEETVGLKIYPKSKSGKLVTTGSIGLADPRTIIKALQIARKYHKVADFHPEDPEIIERDGKHSRRSEFEYVRQVLSIAEMIPKVKIVLCHISCVESLELIIRAQKKGMRVAIELTPHHLWFTSEGDNWNANLGSVFYHCYSPLRTLGDRETLRRILASSNPLVLIGSDSACHTREEKRETGPAGIPSNQEMVAVICTLAKQLGLSEKRVSNLLSFNAARFFNIRVPHELVPVKLEERIDDLKYNHGKVVNPWIGSKLLFPKFKKEE